MLNDMWCIIVDCSLEWSLIMYAGPFLFPIYIQISSHYFEQFFNFYPFLFYTKTVLHIFQPTYSAGQVVHYKGQIHDLSSVARKLARPLKIVSPTINMFIQLLKGNYRGLLAVLGGFLIQLTAGTYHGTFGNLLPYFSSYVKKVNTSEREDIIFLVWKSL